MFQFKKKFISWNGRTNYCTCLNNCEQKGDGGDEQYALVIGKMVLLYMTEIWKEGHVYNEPSAANIVNVPPKI